MKRIKWPATVFVCWWYDNSKTILCIDAKVENSDDVKIEEIELAIDRFISRYGPAPRCVYVPYGALRPWCGKIDDVEIIEVLFEEDDATV